MSRLSLICLSFFVWVIPGFGQSLVINEVMYAPLAPEPEWIELYNPTNDTISTRGLTITVKTRTVSLPSTRIPPHTFRVVSANDSLLVALHSLDTASVLTAKLPALANAGAWIVLHDSSGLMLDSMWYTAKQTRSGQSLERLNPYRAATDTSEWRGSIDSSQNTLLRPNSWLIQRVDEGLSIVSVSAHAITVRIHNKGLDTLGQTSIVLSLEDRQVDSKTLTLKVPPYDSADLAIAVSVQLPYGRFEVEAVTNTPEDSSRSNDSARYQTTLTPIPPRMLAVNEILYQPRVGTCEWIELTNTSDASVSLRDCALTVGDTSAVPLAIRSLVMQPNSLAVIAANNTFWQDFPDLATRREVVIMDRSALGLSDDSGTIVFRSDSQLTLDSVMYHASWQNPVVVDAHGISLERRSPSRTSILPANWTSSSDERGSTPLASNSASHTSDGVDGALSVQIIPNPTIVGASARTRLIVNGIEAQGLIRLRVFGRGGQLLRTFNELLWNGWQETSFDGEDDDGRPLPPGLYTLLVEVADSQGHTSTKRVGLVIAPAN